MALGRLYKGIGISNGKIKGRIKFYNKEERQEKKSAAKDKEQELTRLDKALAQAVKQIKALEERARTAIGEKEAQIFEIHAMLLEDEDYVASIIGEINGGESAEAAVRKTAKAYAEMLEALDDDYLSARKADIRDISDQLIRVLQGDVSVFDENDIEPYILVAEDLTPSETVRLDPLKILGFVTFGGTPSSHTAILARSMGIPALVGAERVDRAFDGKTALLNAEKGTLLVNPSKQETTEFEREQQEYNKIAKEHERYLRSVMNKPAVTRSGHKIMIYANVGNEVEVGPAITNGAEGIGLLRSEFLYISRESYPTEEELFYAYRDIAIKMQGKRVVIRTLDIGADKQVPYLRIPSEENPALGYRAIRVCLDRRDLFKTQLRAILRASAFGRISLMLPMVVCDEEIRESKQLLEEAKRELLTQGEGFDAKIELGIMIETPAAAIMAETLAKEVDFFSVGTNDLAQYTLAADRQNARVAHICENNPEPVLRLIKTAADAIHKEGGWIGVCGEMAADLNLTQRFATIGVDELSVSVPYLLGVRGKVSECR